MSDARIETVLGPLLRIARRRQLLVSVWAHHCDWGVALVGMIAMVGTLTARGELAPAWWFVLTASLVPVIATLLAYRTLPSPRALLREIDGSLDNHDLLGAAYEFAAGSEEDSVGADADFVRSAKSSIYTSAAKHASEVCVSGIFSLRRYRLRRADLAVVCALVAAVLVPATSPDPAVTDATEAAIEPPLPAPAVEPRTRALVAPLRRELADLRVNDDELGALASALDRLLEAVHPDDAHLERALTELDALEAALERLQQASRDDLWIDPELLGAGVREIAEQLRTEEGGRPIARALGELDATGVEAALARALDSERRGGDDGEDSSQNARRERLLRRVSEGVERALKRQTKTAEELQTLERRLARNSSDDDPRAARRAREAAPSKERLERLRRRQRAEQRARDRLDRLRREARNLRRRSREPAPSHVEGSSGPEGERPARAGDEGARARPERALIEGLADATDRVSRSQRMTRTQAAVKAAGRTLRRLADDGTRSRSMEAHAEAFARAAQGERAAPGAQGTRANAGAPLQAAGDAEPRALAMSTQGSPASRSGQGNGAGAASAGPSPHLFGADEVALPAEDEVNPTSRSLAGTPGPGTSRAVTIHEATQRGFANTTYEDVFTDYRGFAQSALDDETIPTSQRDAARRYFRLIQPRK